MNNKKFDSASELYDEGRHAEAFELFTQLANEGDVSAMTRIACMYAEGKGVEHSIEESIKWDMRAADLGSTTALYNLGITYRNSGNSKCAKEWLQRALRAGEGEAALELAKLSLAGERDAEQAVSYLEMALDCDNISEQSKVDALEMLKELMT